MKFKIHSEEDKTPLILHITRLSCNKKEWEVNVSLCKKKRSTSQNALYHMWLNCIAKETNGDVDGIAEEFRRRYLGYKTVPVFGSEMMVVRSTADLSSEDFTNFLYQIQMFCETELGISLPNPEDRFFEQFADQFE